MSFPAGVFYRRLRRPQGLDEEFAVGQHLRVAEGDLLSGVPLDLRRDHPGEVLPEVINPLSVWRGEHSYGLQTPDCAHRCADLGQQLRIRPGFCDVGGPEGDSTLVNGGIVDFSVVPIGKAQPSLPADGPAFVGADHFPAPVRVFQMQLGKQTRRIGVGFVRAGKGEGSHSPARADAGGDLIVTLMQIHDRVALVLDLVLIAGKAGGKVAVALLFAVYAQLVDPQRRGTDPGPDGLLRQAQLFFE